jgi:cytochrome c1
MAALALLATISTTAEGPVWRVIGGDPQRGPGLIVAYGCAACHTVPGVSGANGNVGPPLTRFGGRTYIAGMLRNSPANLVRWIRDPQGVVPGNAMPNMGVSDAEARDIAAYLYTLR